MTTQNVAFTNTKLSTPKKSQQENEMTKVTSSSKVSKKMASKSPKKS